MKRLSIQIVRFVDVHQPGWVEARFEDANGETHRFIDKVPTFTHKDLDADSTYPQQGYVCCEVISDSKNSSGRRLVEIEADRMESTDGLSRFVVASEQLSDDI